MSMLTRTLLAGLFTATFTLPALAETPVSVTILRFIQIEDPDPTDVIDEINSPDVIGHGDFYPQVRIGQAPFQRRRSDFEESRDFRPFWTFSNTVDQDVGTIPIVIRMWDADEFENNDDIIDLNIDDNVQELVLVLDLETCTWSGDVEAGVMVSKGDGDHEHFGALEGGEAGQILFDVSCSENGDFDGDGIPDGVERFGVVNPNGVLLSDLSDGITRPDPCRPNIIVQYDMMSDANHNHIPHPSALNMLRTAFNNAGTLVDAPPPSDCPYAGFPTRDDGGIGLILIRGDEIGERTPVRLSDLPEIRDASLDAELKPYVHYALWAHDVASSVTSARVAGVCCEGKDFIISLGGFGSGNGSILRQAGTFMHELGHALGLSHWGKKFIDVDQNGNETGRNCKPNYQSVMNYFFSGGMVDVNTGDQIIDFSRSALPTIDESALTEATGIGGSLLRTSWCDPSNTARGGAGNGPLDWDWSGMGTTPGITPGTVGVDIAAVSSGRGGCCRDRNGTISSPGDKLSGFADWRNLEFRAPMAPGAGEAIEVVEDELTVEGAEAIDAFWESQLRCSPPENGDWIIPRDCTIWRDVTAPGDLIVASDTVLSIGAGVTLDIDFANHALRIAAGSRVEVQPRGRLQ